MRRLRRTGRVPGVLYGGDIEPVSFDVEARELRSALAAAGAVLDLSIDEGEPTSVVVKDAQHHPVRGETVHIDLLRVRLDRPIHAIVPLELHGADESPGVKQGGILEQITRELNIEALPNAIPSAITHDVAALAMGDTLIARAKAETGLPEGRLTGERGRTINQLKMFALHAQTRALIVFTANGGLHARQCGSGFGNAAGFSPGRRTATPAGARHSLQSQGFA